MSRRSIYENRGHLRPPRNPTWVVGTGVERGRIIGYLDANGDLVRVTCCKDPLRCERPSCWRAFGAGQLK